MYYVSRVLFYRKIEISIYCHIASRKIELSFELLLFIALNAIVFCFMRAVTNDTDKCDQ